MWLAPLAALLLGAVALWYFFGRPAAPVARNAARDAADATANTANRAANATGEAAAGAVTALRPTLPDVTTPNITTVSKDLSGVFTSATSALGGIRDAASAQAALPKLEALDARIDGIRDVLDKLPPAGQAALGQLVGKEQTPIREQAAEIVAMPDVSDEVKLKLVDITSKLRGLNLAQVSQDATGIFTTLTGTLSGFKDVASAEAALPRLQEVSGKLDDLKRVQTHMSPGGQSMLAKIIAAARGPLDRLIAQVLTTLGADAAVVKPVLDEIVGKLTGLSPPGEA